MASSSNLNSFLSYVYVVTDVSHEGEISNPFRDEFRLKQFSTGNFGFWGVFSGVICLEAFRMIQMNFSPIFLNSEDNVILCCSVNEILAL